MAVVTTGFFDGVHLGHRHVIERLVSTARERGDESLVVTFWPHPRTVFQRDARDLRILNSLDEKVSILRSLGVDRIEILPFTKQFAAMTAEKYIRDALIKRLDAKVLVVGYDNTIGSDTLGYEELSALNCIEVVPAGIGSPNPSLRSVPPIESDGFRDPIATGTAVSSTRIRKALEAGEIDAANAMLGYCYGLKGVVVAGNRMGRTIGFPTANMQLYEPLKLVPANGVYAVEVETLGGHFHGMCNIGMRPTVGGRARTIETNIFDFNEDIYGLDLSIRFRRYLRKEKHFPSLEVLREQLVEDRKNAETSLAD